MGSNSACTTPICLAWSQKAYDLRRARCRLNCSSPRSGELALAHWRARLRKRSGSAAAASSSRDRSPSTWRGPHSPAAAARAATWSKVISPACNLARALGISSNFCATWVICLASLRVIRRASRSSSSAPVAPSAASREAMAHSKADSPALSRPSSSPRRRTSSKVRRWPACSAQAGNPSRKERHWRIISFITPNLGGGCDIFRRNIPQRKKSTQKPDFFGVPGPNGENRPGFYPSATARRAGSTLAPSRSMRFSWSTAAIWMVTTSASMSFTSGS